MKKVVFTLLLGSVFLSSCSTIFTASKQDITFVGKEGTRIYDNGQKIATIGESGETSVSVRKRISSKELVAKKDGYKPKPVVLHTKFSTISCINLLNAIAWAIDLGTQKVCKWDNTYIEIEMEEDK